MRKMKSSLSGNFTLTGTERRLVAGFARPFAQSRLQNGAPSSNGKKIEDADDEKILAPP